jgi:hypothetical protein
MNSVCLADRWLVECLRAARHDCRGNKLKNNNDENIDTREFRAVLPREEFPVQWRGSMDIVNWWTMCVRGMFTDTNEQRKLFSEWDWWFARRENDAMIVNRCMCRWNRPVSFVCFHVMTINRKRNEPDRHVIDVRNHARIESFDNWIERNCRRTSAVHYCRDETKNTHMNRWILRLLRTDVKSTDRM